MTSIRTRLFLNTSFLVIFFMFVGWLLSTLILEEYYLWNKKHSIVENSKIIEQIYNANDPNISLELERIGSNLGAGIIITNQDGYIKYSSMGRIGEPNAFFMPQDHHGDNPAFPPHKTMPKLVLKTSETIDENSVIEVEEDQILNIDFLSYKRILNNNDILRIRVPLAALSESAAYASKFLAFSGIISILIGCVWAFFFAKKFTVPLLELSDVAQSISQLNFTQSCTIRSNDEIGILGKSINNLSYQLNKAISELNQKNLQLLKDVEKERRLEKLRKNFISSVSHELKTPISLILGYAEGLKENVINDEEQKDYYCSVIIDEANKLDKLVKDLLDLSQIESGFFRLDRTDFDLSLLLDQIVLKYRTVFLEKNLSLQLEKAPQLLANGDAMRIEQVLANFLNNALDHVDSSGLIEINAQEINNKIRVSVFNTGNHIPSDSLDNLWLSFYKVDQARTRAFGGYGLGLSVVRGIQELHNNAFGVENITGGVKFWFELDLATKI
ncbi:MAG: phoR 3 [Firmicutes bacterium]|nr:phoR 3 [Bacillota bacterium]